MYIEITGLSMYSKINITQARSWG